MPRSVQPPTYEAYEFYARGGEEFTSGNYRAAADWFERAYHSDTTYLRSLMLVAVAWGNAGYPEKSDSVLRLVQPRRQELAPYDRYRLDFATAGFRGDLAAQLRAARAGSELVPVGTMRVALVLSLIAVNRPREALQELEAIWEASVDLQWFFFWRVYTQILHLLGDHERELEIALQGREQLQGSLHTMAYHGHAVAALGRADELLSLVDEIRLIAPQPGIDAGSVLQQIALELRRHGQPQAALEVIERALEWWDEQPQQFKASGRGREQLGWLHYQNENWDEAAAVFRALTSDSGTMLNALGASGTSAARRGDADAARAFSRELGELDLPYLNGMNTLWRARIAALLGDNDDAVELLRRAFAEGLGHDIILHRDMDLEVLRGYEPFDELMRPKG